MSASRMMRIAFLSGIVGVIGMLDLADGFSTFRSFGIVSSAEARVGRPLTPVSVAGTARRTARRCAAGVYNC